MKNFTIEDFDNVCSNIVRKACDPQMKFKQYSSLKYDSENVWIELTWGRLIFKYWFPYKMLYIFDIDNLKNYKFNSESDDLDKLPEILSTGMCGDFLKENPFRDKA